MPGGLKGAGSGEVRWGTWTGLAVLDEGGADRWVIIWECLLSGGRLVRFTAVLDRTMYAW
jgi:hypothetical protein